MKATYTTSAIFLAIVKTDDPTRAFINRYLVTVRQTDPADVEVTGIKTALNDLVSRINGRQIDVMMPGAVPTLIGIASWIMEQLALNFPRLSAIVLAVDDDTITIERETTR